MDRIVEQLRVQRVYGIELSQPFRQGGKREGHLADFAVAESFPLPRIFQPWHLRPLLRRNALHQFPRAGLPPGFGTKGNFSRCRTDKPQAHQTKDNPSHLISLFIFNSL